MVRWVLEEKKHHVAEVDVILDTIVEHVMIVSMDFKILYANKALSGAVGLRSEDVIGKHCYEITHHRKTPCAPPKQLCPLTECKKGKPCTLTHTHYDKDGNEFYVEVTAMPWKEKGEIVGFAHMARVITERKRGELASAVAAREKAAIVDVTCDGLIVTDLDGNITSVNKAMEEYLAEAGVDVKKFVGESAHHLLKKYAELIKETIEKGKAGPLEAGNNTGRSDR